MDFELLEKLERAYKLESGTPARKAVIKEVIRKVRDWSKDNQDIAVMIDNMAVQRSVSGFALGVLRVTNRSFMKNDGWNGLTLGDPIARDVKLLTDMHGRNALWLYNQVVMQTAMALIEGGAEWKSPLG